MTVSKHTIFRPNALAHYSQPVESTPTSVSDSVNQQGFWALLRLIAKLIVGVVMLPFTFWRWQRVPIVLQMTTTQCGAACLTMLLNFYGRATSLAEVDEQMDVGRDGATALAIAQAARHFGLNVRAFTGEPEQLADIALPAILHWNFSHFVVLEAWNQNEAVIVDPAAGRRPVSLAEFDRSFTGVVLMLEPEATFQRRRSASGSAIWRQQIQRLLIASGAWRAGIKALLATVAVQVVTMAFMSMTRVCIRPNRHGLPTDLMHTQCTKTYS